MLFHCTENQVVIVFCCIFALFKMNFKQYFQSEKIVGLKNRLKEYLSPLQERISPLLQWYAEKTEPLRQRWNVFSQAHPKKSTAIAWTAKMTGYGLKFLFGLIFAVYIGVFGHMPSKKELKTIETANASEIYTADSVLIGKFFTENRTNISLDSMSPYLITALLAIEDKRFFEHSGIDMRSWLRAFKGVATNQKELGGGSTLSQQLAKNLYPRKNYLIPGFTMLVNKIRENITSIKLEKLYNKEQLLALYLNTVPFGGNRYGIQEASRYFYNKKPKDLTPDQAATLIGMLKATTALDPTRNPNNSRARRDLVLSQMLKNKDFRFESSEMTTISKMIRQGTITEESYKTWIQRPVNARVHEDIGTEDGTATYFREFLRTKELPRILKNLMREDDRPYNMYTDGLKIYTTLDSRMQSHAEAAVHKHMAYLQEEFQKHWKGYTDEKPWGDDKWIDEQVKKSERYQAALDAGLNTSDIDSLFLRPVPMKVMVWKDKPSEIDTMLTPLDSVRYYFTMLNCGFMAMDYKKGHIKAWVGGIDFKHYKYDHILSKRQVGSIFKPVVYTAAVTDSVKPCEYIRNERVTIEDWSPGNADETYNGWYTVMGGLAYSVNVIAAKMIEKVGIQKTIDLARSMGVTGELPFEWGISLGSADISLFDMMKVFGTLANQGLRPEPVSITRIEDRYGNIIYDIEQEIAKNPAAGPHVQAVKPEVAAIMNRMLQAVIHSGTGNPLRSQFVPHGEFGGKTGTSQNHSDGWFIAYNPELLTGAWVGGPSPAVRFRNMALGSGSATALPIVGNFWYNLVLDDELTTITKSRFTYDQAAASLTSCPMRIDIAPDTLQMLLQDSTVRDSILSGGYKNLRQITNDRFSIPEGEVPAEEVPEDESNRQGILPEKRKSGESSKKDNGN
jgi:penicillin-binding protein 1A